MPATNQIQIQRAFEAAARKFYQSGIAPDLYQVLNKLSTYFAHNPPGNPLSMDVQAMLGIDPTDVDAMNNLLANLYNNLAVLYDTCIIQSNEVLLENQILLSRINQISKRQQNLLAQVNDYLFSLYNTGGYYFSITDTFADTSKTDLVLTSAFIDTSKHQVTIPLLGSGFSTIIPNTLIGNPTIQVTDSAGNSLNYTTITPFSYAVSGTDNIVWEIQVVQNNPGPVTVELFVPFTPTLGASIDLSRIEFNPYSMVPFQLYPQVGLPDTSGMLNIDYVTFGNNIVTSANDMTFTGSAKGVMSVKFTMNKNANDYDFQTNVNGTLQYVYIFGARNISFAQQVYDNNAIFVSEPLSMLSSSSNVIDAVALQVSDVVPAGTHINYFVANNNPNAQHIGDFVWRPIQPLLQNQKTDIVQFNGAYTSSVYIRSVPRSSSDLQLLPINTSATLESNWNPNPLIIPGVDTYILTDFAATYLPNSISLEEGVNSTRVYYIVGPDEPEDISFWAGVINNQTPQAPSLTYGEIDVGNGFFYGGSLRSDSSITANIHDVSLFIETYLYLDGSIAPVIDTFNKADVASKTWDVDIYLNGSLLASMPGRNNRTSAANLTPIDSNLLTWNFQQGINHVAVIVYIPRFDEVGGVVPAPYLGTIEILQNNPLYTLGTVKLSNWSYVSFFDLQYNQPGASTSFTVHNNQIISRHQPTTNFRLSYAQASGLAPEAIRVRADLSRSIQNENLTPQLDSYSLRFLYGSG